MASDAMGDFVYVLVNYTLAISCLIMALVFFVISVPKDEGLKNYRISLRTLAGAYITLAFLLLLMLFFNMRDDEIFSAIDLLMASLQSTMFTFTLITLFNPRIINVRYVAKHLLPVLLFVILFCISCAIWGYPVLKSMNDLAFYAWHPTVLLRELFVIFYLAQLIYLTRMFRSQLLLFEQQLDNYFTSTFKLRLSWVSYCFYAALSIGLLVLFSLFIPFTIWNNAVTGFFVLFYLIFGLCYVRYPLTYIDIAVVFDNQQIQMQDSLSDNLPSSWENYKQQLLTEKYHLQPGVTIEEMAQFLKISRTTLSGLINKEEEMNFYMWINMLRIKEAQQLFEENPGHTIAKVSEMVGFTEHSNFSRQFKLVTKASPSEWRQQRKA